MIITVPGYDLQEWSLWNLDPAGNHYIDPDTGQWEIIGGGFNSAIAHGGPTPDWTIPQNVQVLNTYIAQQLLLEAIASGDQSLMAEASDAQMIVLSGETSLFPPEFFQPGAVNEPIISAYVTPSLLRAEPTSALPFLEPQPVQPSPISFRPSGRVRLYLVEPDGTVDTGLLPSRSYPELISLDQLSDPNGPLAGVNLDPIAFANVDDVRYYAATHGESLRRVYSNDEVLALMQGSLPLGRLETPALPGGAVPVTAGITGSPLAMLGLAWGLWKAVKG